MAAAFSELVRGVNLLMICLSSRHDDGEFDMNFHGKTTIDHTDEVDMLVQRSIERAMEEKATC